LCGGFGAHEGIRNPGIRLHQDALGSKSSRNLMISAAREHGCDVIFEDLHLLAGDLRPAGVVADDRDDRNAMAHEGVELGKAIPACAVAEDDPDLGLRPAERSAERKAGANPKCAEWPWIEPRARAARPKHIRCRRDEIAAIGDKYGVIAGR